MRLRAFAVVGFLIPIAIFGLMTGMLHGAQQRAVRGDITAPTASPLVLQTSEGERRVRRNVNLPFIIKVDRQNGGARDLVVGYEDIPPGQMIPPHRHLMADEIIFVHGGSGMATVGSVERPIATGATVYIPSDTRVTLRNTGTEPMTIVFVFSKPGFEEYLRDTSVMEGEPATPLSVEERARLLEKHKWHTVFEPMQK